MSVPFAAIGPVVSSGGGTGDALEATSQEILALLQGVMNGDNTAVVAELNTATLRRFVTEDTGEVSASAGSVAKLSQGPAAGNTIVTLQSVAAIQPGVIVGPSEPLIIGDDYITSLGRAIRINLLDSNGDPAIVIFGSYSLADAGIDIQLLLHKAGKPTVVADIVGTCTFSPAVGLVPPYLTVELPNTETEKATPGAYDMQAEAVWLDGKVVTFAPYGQLEFVRDIQRMP